jgi:hypothetical protein
VGPCPLCKYEYQNGHRRRLLLELSSLVRELAEAHGLNTAQLDDILEKMK